MSTQLTKRALTGLGAAGLGVGTLGLLASRASADTPFSSFAFPAAGAPASRTMPDRLSDTKSVKDFGAVGNGSNDDTPAIQAAVNWANRIDRRVIFFPPGTYGVTSPITHNLNGEQSIVFQGVGRLSTIVGNFAGYILDRNLATFNPGGGIRVIQNLNIANAHPAGGGIRLGSVVGGAIRD